MNLKLETEREKVQPFYSTSVANEIEHELSQQDPTEVRDLLNSLMPFNSTTLTRENNSVGQWNFLDNFYKRFNKVALDKLALEKEKERLLKENEDLRALVKQYLGGITVSEDSISGENPLLIINGKMPEPIKVTAKTTTAPSVTGVPQQKVVVLIQ
jgi:hypothetical protein